MIKQFPFASLIAKIQKRKDKKKIEKSGSELYFNLYQDSKRIGYGSSLYPTSRNNIYSFDYSRVNYLIDLDDFQGVSARP